MGTKIWHFLMPSTGDHHLVVHGIGTKDQEVFLDDVPLDSKYSFDDQYFFDGPGGCRLDLRVDKPSPKSSPSSRGKHAQVWTLLVDGHRVEEYVQGGTHDGIRDLREMPEGSYIIAPSFDAASLELNTLRKFQFVVGEAIHEVALAHLENIWQVVFDGKLIERRAHTWRDNTGEACFKVPGPGGEQLPARMGMRWDFGRMLWDYTLHVNGTYVPHCWIKTSGQISGAAPVIIQDLPAPAPPGEDSISKAQGDVELNAGVEMEAPRPVIDMLPQGVSFDTTSGMYQANIKSKNGRFVFLGEFKSPEHAHQKYLEAIPQYCPDKKVAPEY